MRIIEVITESPHSDRLMRQAAIRLYNSLFNQRHRPLFRAAIDDAIPMLYVPTIYPDLAIGLIPNLEYPALIEITKSTLPDKIKYIIGYPVDENTRGRPISDRQALRKVVPHNRAMGKIRTVGDLIKTIGRNLETFVHEFTHYHDSHRAGHIPPHNYDSEGILKGSLEDDKKYFNDPLERNAFFNQAIVNLDRARPEYFRMPFRNWVARMIKTFRPDFIEALEPQAKRRIVNRLYQIWSEKNAALNPRT